MKTTKSKQPADSGTHAGWDTHDCATLIDELQAAVGPLANFILPGGSLSSAQLHIARTVCRRAEREVSTLVHEEGVGPFVMAYLNRLSDALFVMARYENHERGVPEPLWQPNK